MPARKYLVTGGTGFIGSALVKSLVSLGHTVRVLDNDSRGSRRRLSEVADDIEFIDHDIREPEGVRRACQGMDSVCHLAYVNGTEYFYTKPKLVLEVGVKGMLGVLDGCLAEGVDELILMSSSEVYQTPDEIPTPETVPLVVPNPLEARYSYGGGKIISELLAINYGRTDFSRVLIVRPHNVYGPDMGFQHVIPQFVSRLHELTKSQPSGQVLGFPVQGSGAETRAFIHIDDFTEAFHQVLEQGRHLEIYHVGNDQEVTIAEVARQVAKSMGVSIGLVPGELLPGSTLRRCPNITKLRSLGFEPKVSLAAGIDNYVEWFSTTEENPRR